MDPVVNLVQPNSLGALLAEEWAIDPTSVLPSWLEMIMIQETRRSSQAMLSSTIEAALRWLDRVDSGMVQPHTPQASSSLLTRVLQSLRKHFQWSIRRAKIYGSRHKSELQFVLWYLIERSSLRSSASATISEAVYGTTRSKLGTNESSDNSSARRRRLVPLSSVDKTRVALSSALLPYMTEKIQQLYRRLALRSSVHDNLTYSFSEQLFLSSYLPVSLCLVMVKVLMQWQYLEGRSLYFEPLSLLMNHVVRRVSQGEVDANSTLSQKPSEMSHTSAMKEASITRRSILYFLSASVVFSWITQIRIALENHRRDMLRSLFPEVNSVTGPLPPPPPSTGSTRHSKQVEDGICPICLAPYKDPTASSSGHVYCDNCIRSHVRRFRNCPVSGQLCTEKMLVKIFEPGRTNK